MFLQAKQFIYWLYILKWFLLSVLIGIPIGAASTFFLYSLDYVTELREKNLGIIALLPLGGLIIGFLYHYWGRDVAKGNNQILEEFHAPQKRIPFKMAPLILVGTLLTHLFGGSAGREGTAVQIGGAIADQFSYLFRLRPRDRKLILVMGISAGFASVFGTPLAGSIFALEVLIIGRMRYEALIPSFFCAIVAYLTAEFLGVHHTHYTVAFQAPNALNLLIAILCGIAFGLTAKFFSYATHFWQNIFSQRIAYPPLRPLVGGIFLLLAITVIGNNRYVGLGIPIIQEAFIKPLPFYDFVAKVLFTSFTLGCGFKGGEVTPLFFIGATLGSALSSVCNLPTSLCAAMGFVSVFAGASNTPIACLVMGIEIFGIQTGIYLALACITAYLFSGHSGIYTAQIIGSPKHLLFGKNKGKTLHEITTKEVIDKKA
ncbi:MAG: voltage-gated chloride channel family protein [Bacteroidia bacterium]|nr:voltage-gated chloride channel family protein [Bacteroidia bacterium]MDW8157583.1 voltage-gated chloride channel family protein [Bacteroidia bacterium]